MRLSTRRTFVSSTISRGSRRDGGGGVFADAGQSQQLVLLSGNIAVVLTRDDRSGGVQPQRSAG